MYRMYLLAIFLLAGCASNKFSAEPIDSNYRGTRLNQNVSISHIDIVNSNISEYNSGYYYLKSDLSKKSNSEDIFKFENDPTDSINKTLKTCINNAGVKNKNNQQISAKLNLTKLEMQSDTEPPLASRTKISTSLYYDLEILGENGNKLASLKDYRVYGAMTFGRFKTINPTESFILAEQELCDSIIESINKIPPDNRSAIAKQLDNTKYRGMTAYFAFDNIIANSYSISNSVSNELLYYIYIKDSYDKYYQSGYKTDNEYIYSCLSLFREQRKPFLNVLSRDEFNNKISNVSKSARKLEEEYLEKTTGKKAKKNEIDSLLDNVDDYIKKVVEKSKDDNLKNSDFLINVESTKIGNFDDKINGFNMQSEDNRRFTNKDYLNKLVFGYDDQRFDDRDKLLDKFDKQSDRYKSFLSQFEISNYLLKHTTLRFDISNYKFILPESETREYLTKFRDKKIEIPFSIIYTVDKCEIVTNNVDFLACQANIKDIIYDGSNLGSLLKNGKIEKINK